MLLITLDDFFVSPFKVVSTIVCIIRGNLPMNSGLSSYQVICAHNSNFKCKINNIFVYVSVCSLNTFVNDVPFCVCVCGSPVPYFYSAWRYKQIFICVLFFFRIECFSKLVLNLKYNWNSEICFKGYNVKRLTPDQGRCNTAVNNFSSSRMTN